MNIKTKDLIKNCLLFVALIVMYIIYHGVLSPLAEYVYNDIIYMNGYFPIVLDVALAVLQIVIWAHIFAIIISAIMKSEKKIFLRALFPLLVLFIFRYFLVSVISISFDDGALRTDDVIYLFLDSLLYSVLDFLHVLVLYLAYKLFVNKQKLQKRIFISSAISGIIIAFGKILMRLIYDIHYFSVTQVDSWSEEIAWSVLYYSLDLISGIFVFLLTIALAKLYSKEYK